VGLNCQGNCKKRHFAIVKEEKICKNMFKDGRCRFNHKCRYHHPTENQRKNIQDKITEDQSEYLQNSAFNKNTSSKNLMAEANLQVGKEPLAEQLLRLFTQLIEKR